MRKHYLPKKTDEENSFGYCFGFSGYGSSDRAAPANR
jgi:hypothetical protein